METPTDINNFSQQQEYFSIQQDEQDTSNYCSTKGGDSCDTVQQNMEAYYNVGETFFDALLDLKEKGLSRLPLLSLACATTKLTRKDIIQMLGHNVSKYEWTKASAHAKFPGPGHPVPVKPKYRCKQFEDVVVEEFLEWLNSHDFLQNLSFGQKVIRLYPVHKLGGKISSGGFTQF